jgi:ribosome-associated protein
MNERLILNKIAQIIFDKKGYNILALDLRDISSLTDFVILAEGMVDQHVLALSQAIEDYMTQQKSPLYHREGTSHGDWVVLDYGWLMIHLFMPGMRQKYCLEELWKDAKIIDLAILTDPLRF